MANKRINKGITLVHKLCFETNMLKNIKINKTVFKLFRLFASALLLLIIIQLSACNSSNTKKNVKGPVTITFWHSLSSSSAAALGELLKRFESTHPNIKIKAQYVPSGNAFLYKLATAVKSHNAPDVSWLYAGSFKELIESNAIYSMKHFIKGKDGLSDSVMNDFYPALLNLGSWKSKLYGLPMEATNFALYYNKDLFRKAGLQHPPQTWNQLYSYAKKLSVDKNHDGKYEKVGVLLPVHPADGPLGGFMVWYWKSFLWDDGGYIVNKDQTKVLFNSQAGVNALTLWKNIYNDLNLNNFSADQNVAFASKLTAMFFDGPWDLPQFDKLFKGIDWGVSPVPGGTVKQTTNAGGEYLVIFKQSKHPKADWEFVKWIIQPETQAFWSMKSGYLPVRKSVLQLKNYKDFLLKHPDLEVFVKQMAHAEPARPIDYHAMQIDHTIAGAIEKATLGKEDPKKALDDAAVKADKILNSGND